MKLPSKLTKIGKPLMRKVYANLPLPGVRRPIFIIGCGRSGTTILGTALSQHREVTYLNEPRYLWFSAYPKTDVWSIKAKARKGKLLLTETDIEQRKSNKLSRLFRYETIISRRSVLIEKLPINNFRLNFIQQIFPDARFIHIYRNGLEVAKSIEKLSEQGHWFGSKSYKWEQLVDYSMNLDDVHNLTALCTTYFDKGLLEWRLSTESAVTFLRSLSDNTFFELNYDQFLADPVKSVSQIFDFIGVDNDPKVKDFVLTNVARRSSKLGLEAMSAKAQMIGGEILPLSMDVNKNLTRF